MSLCNLAGILLLFNTCISANEKFTLYTEVIDAEWEIHNGKVISFIGTRLQDESIRSPFPFDSISRDNKYYHKEWITPSPSTLMSRFLHFMHKQSNWRDLKKHHWIYTPLYVASKAFFKNITNQSQKIHSNWKSTVITIKISRNTETTTSFK